MIIGIALAAFKPDIQIFFQQLQSIQTQEFKNWICVITCDSPLHDFLNSQEMKPFRDDSRFVWIENEHRLGHKKNFEKAIQETLRHSVDFIACADQDDIWYENKLSECASVLSSLNKGSLVHSDMNILEKNQILENTAWTIERRGILNSKAIHLMVRNIVAGCSMMFDSDLARRYPLIPSGAEFHDHWYALVSSYHGGIRAISTPLYAYRQHPKNEVGVSPFKKIFSLPQSITFLQILIKCRKGWYKSKNLALSAKKAGLPLSLLEKTLFIYRFDFGLGLILMGVFYILNDPPLARACFARGIGKFLFFLNPQENSSKK